MQILSSSSSSLLFPHLLLILFLLLRFLLYTELVGKTILFMLWEFLASGLSMRWSFLVSVEPLPLPKEGQGCLELSILFLHKLYLLFLLTFPPLSSKTHSSCQLKAIVVLVMMKFEAKNLSFFCSLHVLLYFSLWNEYPRSNE